MTRGAGMRSLQKTLAPPAPRIPDADPVHHELKLPLDRGATRPAPAPVAVAVTSTSTIFIRSSSGSSSSSSSGPVVVVMVVMVIFLPEPGRRSRRGHYRRHRPQRHAGPAAERPLRRQGLGLVLAEAREVGQQAAREDPAVVVVEVRLDLDDPGNGCCCWRWW